MARSLVVASGGLIVATAILSSASSAELPSCDRPIGTVLSVARKFPRFGIVGPFTIDQLDDAKIRAANVTSDWGTLERMKSKYESGDQFYFVWVDAERGPLLWKEHLLVRNDCIIDDDLVIIR